MSIQRAKELAYRRWTQSLEYVRSKSKCRDYGNKETLDSIWDKLPQVSKDYWVIKTI